MMSDTNPDAVFDRMLGKLVAQNRSLFPTSNPFVPETFHPRYTSVLHNKFRNLQFSFFYLQSCNSNDIKRKFKVESSYDAPQPGTTYVKRGDQSNNAIHHSKTVVLIIVLCS